MRQTHALATAIETLYRAHKNPTKVFVAAARSRMDRRTWFPCKSYSLNLSRTPSKVNNLSSTRQCVRDDSLNFSCLWFRASLIYINNCPTRCNTKQSIYYPASSLYMFRVSTTPVIRNTQNCNYSLRYYSLQRGQASLATLEGGSCTKKIDQYRRL